jgi:hypothetical protein
MDDNSTHRKSNRKQLPSDLLWPPRVFLLGHGMLSSLANEAARRWLDPITRGSVFAIVYLTQFLPLSRSASQYSFGPKPPNNRQLALVFAVSTALNAIIVCELLLFWQRESMQKTFPNYLFTLLAVLAPIAISFGFYTATKRARSRRVTELVGKVAASFAKVAFARRTANRFAIGSRMNSHDLALIAVAIVALHRLGLVRDRSLPAEELRSPLRVAFLDASTPHPTYAFRQAYSAICASSLATSRCTILLRSRSPE